MPHPITSQTHGGQQAGHTPSPWLIAQDRGPLYIAHAGSQRRIATIADNPNDQRIACANARLIAASPDLLKIMGMIKSISEEALADSEKQRGLKLKGIVTLAQSAIEKATRTAL